MGVKVVPCWCTRSVPYPHLTVRLASRCRATLDPFSCNYGTSIGWLRQKSQRPQPPLTIVAELSDVKQAG